MGDHPVFVLICKRVEPFDHPRDFHLADRIHIRQLLTADEHMGFCRTFREHIVGIVKG
ncbi:hypothetical protein D3C81_1926580 [compost metagenome]